MRAWQVHHVLGPRSRLIQRSSGQPRGEDRHPEIRVNPTDAHTLPTPNPPQKKRRKGGSTKREKEPLVRSCSLCRREGACRRSEDGGDLDLQPPQCSRRSRTAAANWRIFAPTENHAKVPRARLAPPVSSHSFNIPIHRYINDSSMPRIDTLQDFRTRQIETLQDLLLLPGWIHCASGAVLRQRPSYATFNSVPEGAAVQTC